MALLARQKCGSRLCLFYPENGEMSKITAIAGERENPLPESRDFCRIAAVSANPIALFCFFERRMKRIIFLIAGILLGTAVLPAQSAAIELRDTTYAIINTQLEVLEDPDNSLAIEQVQHRVFRPRQEMKFIFGYEHETLWARFKMVNRTQQNRVFMAEVVNPFIPKLGCYQIGSDGKLDTSFITGSGFHFAERPLERRNFMFPLRLDPGDSCQVYFSISKDFLPNSTILLTDYDTREGIIRRYEDILLTVFFVFCSLYLLLSALVFSITRQRFQWYYFGYVLLTACFISTHLGHGFQYLWRDQPILQFIIPSTLNILRLIFGIWFFRLYFEITRYARHFNFFLNTTIALFLLTPILQVVYTLWQPQTGVYQAAMFYGYLFFCSYLVFFSLVILAWALREIFYKRRTRSATLFIIVALNFVGLATTSLQSLGYNLLDLTPDYLFTNKLNFTTQTFYIPVPVMAAFFFEILLVFNFSLRKYIRLFEKDQRAQLKIAKAREEGLNALIMGVENERRRIARDLHDGACVHLAAVNMQIDSLRETLTDQPELSNKLAGITDDIEQTYREVRGISHDLMSKALEKTDLQVALEDLVMRCRQAQPGLDIQLYTHFRPDEVTSLAKIHLYRILQELLGNVLKHAEARQVSVQLLEDQGNLLITVEDDGKGFHPDAQGHSDGIGLANVRTRVEVLRGTLHLESKPGRGTFVNIEVSMESTRSIDHVA